ncbi:MAG: 16S rRNA (guanine(527)-N(7))-methyltransferase RsmG [Anaerolineae bacterium]|nr:16S rRNA (guanine(527)-N(7))-methyltransferase RsmG [Anaerolineae bacterium]
MEYLAQIATELLDLTLSPAHRAAFQRYSDELREWNRRVNLTAIIEPQAIEVRHFVDSLTCLLVMKPPLSGLNIIDVGSGAGFPGLPIKILCPGVKMSLLESTGKKVAFLEHVVRELKLEDVTLINERAETVGQTKAHREQYDWVLARAVAGMSSLAEYLLPLCKIGGHCLALKGENAAQEVAEGQHAITVLGGHIVQLTPIELPTVAETHYLVDIEKIAATPPRFPRRPGMPVKKPL